MKIESSGKTAESLLNDPPTNADKYRPLFSEGNRLIAEARQLLQEGLISDFAALFDVYPEIKTLQLRGYTPSWNDGDPCLHTQREPKINGFERWGENPSETGRVSRETEIEVSSYTNSESENLEEVFGTNWQLDFTRMEDGSIDFEKSDYDCGR
jgi:hypothetical protein